MDSVTLNDYSAKVELVYDSSSRRNRHSSIPEVGSSGSGSKPDSIFQDEIGDWRLVYIDDPDKTNDYFNFAGNSIRTEQDPHFTVHFIGACSHRPDLFHDPRHPIVLELRIRWNFDGQDF